MTAYLPVSRPMPPTVKDRLRVCWVEEGWGRGGALSRGCRGFFLEAWGGVMRVSHLGVEKRCEGRRAGLYVCEDGDWRDFKKDGRCSDFEVACIWSLYAILNALEQSIGEWLYTRTSQCTIQRTNAYANKWFGLFWRSCGDSSAKTKKRREEPDEQWVMHLKIHWFSSMMHTINHFDNTFKVISNILVHHCLDILTVSKEKEIERK